MGPNSISKAVDRGSDKDAGRQKKTNRLAKLKQSKLDARREQWLSLVKNKEHKVESIGSGGPPFPSSLVIDEGNRSPESSEVQSKGLSFESSSISIGNSEWSLSSPVFSSESSRCGSESVSDNDHCLDDWETIPHGCLREWAAIADGCLDDWEAIADTLMTTEKQLNPITKPFVGREGDPQNDDHTSCNNNSEIHLSKQKSEELVSRVHENCRAWRPDDAFRPQCLPNMLKKHVIKNSTFKAISWARRNIISQPVSCPICYEDLDLTDSRFFPCPCGFRLCLFCHKRILEADGRCPGCRKQYEPEKGTFGSNEV